MADISNQAVKIAIDDLEQNLVQYGRDYEDAQRANDPYSAANALRMYNSVNVELQNLTGANQPEQPGLSQAQQNFLQRRQAMGDELSPQRMQEYAAGHVRAIAAGWRENTPEYFRAIEGHVDNLGDGRQAPLNERSAAQLCGVSEQEYAQNAQKLRQLKARGFYQE